MSKLSYDVEIHTRAPNAVESDVLWTSRSDDYCFTLRANQAGKAGPGGLSRGPCLAPFHDLSLGGCSSPSEKHGPLILSRLGRLSNCTPVPHLAIAEPL